jgi:ribonuclease E
MSNTDVPAAAAGGDTRAPTAEQRFSNASTDRLLEDLPAKIRVHALAKLLGLTSKDVLAALIEIGSPARGAQSNVERNAAVQVAEALLPEPPQPHDDDADEIGDVGLNAPLTPVFVPPQPLFLPPRPVAPDADVEYGPNGTASNRSDRSDPSGAPDLADPSDLADPPEVPDPREPSDAEADDTGARRRRRRGRRGRGRGKGAQDDGDAVDELDESIATDAEDEDADPVDANSDDEAAEQDGTGTRRRRRRRRRKGAAEEEATRDDDPPDTVVHFRDSRPGPGPRPAEQDDGVQGVKGSTRLEAKRQRRRDGREAGRRRAPILSEAEFLARRESVDRTMVVREHDIRSDTGTAGSDTGTAGISVQIGVLEDRVLVEHFVTSSGSGSLVGNVYLGRVQNVLPSMEAAFVDIGRGRNAVLYAGEVDWDAAGLEGKARKIEQALNTGDSVLVQVTKDPVGHKGARLTTQISLPGRFLVYVPSGGATGISRKLPDTERRRLKDILKRIVPEDAGVIIRTASEGISEDALARDVRRLQAQWEVIKTKSEATGSGKPTAPQLLYEEPDLLIKVIRDLFTEDFEALVVQGADAWDTIEAYIQHVAPDLAPRLRRHVGPVDVFTDYRIDEQIIKALDRKVWLPSGGYLVIDRTEAMTVIDVNTGKFTGSGGNLEETVTRNNLEAAEEIVRQLRLRDIGGIIVIDFIDMVLESNRDLVLRRLTECLGRDRTRHQVAEVTSLGLVQMTRKRVGSGLLESFSKGCEHCRGRGVIVTTEPIDHPAVGAEPAPVRRSRTRGKPSIEQPSPVDVEPTAEAGTEPARPSGKSRRSRRVAVAEQQAEAAPVAEPPAAMPVSTPAAAAGAGDGSDGQPDDADVDGSPAAGISSHVGADGTADVGGSADLDGPVTFEDRIDSGGPVDTDGAVTLEGTLDSSGAVDSGGTASVDETVGGEDAEKAAPVTRRGRRRRAASRPAGPPVPGDVSQAG